MTEKRKRGRPPGSGKKGSKNKPKIVENLKPDGLPDGVLLLDGDDTKPPGYAIDIEKCPDRDPQKMIKIKLRICSFNYWVSLRGDKFVFEGLRDNAMDIDVKEAASFMRRIREACPHFTFKIDNK